MRSTRCARARSRGPPCWSRERPARQKRRMALDSLHPVPYRMGKPVLGGLRALKGARAVRGRGRRSPTPGASQVLAHFRGSRSARPVWSRRRCDPRRAAGAAQGGDARTGETHLEQSAKRPPAQPQRQASEPARRARARSPSPVAAHRGRRPSCSPGRAQAIPCRLRLGREPRGLPMAAPAGDRRKRVARPALRARQGGRGRQREPLALRALLVGSLSHARAASSPLRLGITQHHQQHARPLVGVERVRDRRGHARDAA